MSDGGGYSRLTPPRSDLADDLVRWVAEGIISGEQADRLFATETARRVAVSVEPKSRPPRRLPLVAEVMGYIGIAIAGIAAATIVGSYWTDLSTWSRLLLVGAATLLAFVAGLAVPSTGEAALRRFGSVLWFFASAGVAGFTVILGADALDLAPETTALLVGVATLLSSAGMYVTRRLGLQQLACLGGAVTVVVALVAQAEDANAFAFGLAVWGIGVIWTLLAVADLLPPATTGIMVGVLTALIGAQIIVAEKPAQGLILGVATAVVLLGWSIAKRARGPLIAGSVGVFVFIPQIVLRILDTGDVEESKKPVAAALAFFVLGVAVVLTAVIVGRRGDRSDRRFESGGPDAPP